MHLRSYLYLIVVIPAALVIVYLAYRNADALTRESRRRTKLELFFTCAILLVGVTAILRNQIMGVGKTTLAFKGSAADTYDQYIPYYLTLIHDIRKGSLPLWFGNFGLGTSVISNQSVTFDPFNLVLIPLCLVFGDGFLSRAIAITFACRALVSGLLFSHLLVRYCKTPLARIFGATTYGLGGYLFTEGQHYFLGTAWVFLPFVLIALEWLMDSQNGRSFALACAATMSLVCFSPYIAFMILMFVPFYVALRLIVVTKGGLKEYLKRLSLCALAVLSGVLLAGVVLVSVALFLVRETARVTGEQSMAARDPLKMMTTFLSRHETMLLLSRMLGNGLVSCGTNYGYLGGLNELEFFQGGLSCLVFVLLGQFAHWTITEATGRQKVAVCLGSLVVTFYCLNYFLPSFITTFRYPTYRGSLFADALIICALATAVEKRLIGRNPAPVPLALSLMLTAAVLGWSAVHTVNALPNCIYCGLALIAAAVLLLAQLRKPQGTHVAAAGSTTAVLLCAVAVSSVVADSFFTISLYPRNVSPRQFPLSEKSDVGEESREALDYLEENDPGFYRIERSFHTWTRWNDGLILGYGGVSAYNSSEDGDISLFFQQLWPEAITKQTANFSCYAVANNEGLLNAPSAPQMMALTGVRYLIAGQPLDYAWAQPVTQTEHGAYVYRIAYQDIAIAPLYVRNGTVSESEANGLSLDERRQLLDSSLIVDDEAIGDLPSLGEASPTYQTELSEHADGSIEGTLQSSDDAYACLAVPSTSDWIVRVDGTEVPTFRVNYCFVGFRISSGSHTISACYRPAGIGTGAILSGAGLLLALTGIWASHRMYKKGSEAA